MANLDADSFEFSNEFIDTLKQEYDAWKKRHEHDGRQLLTVPEELDFRTLFMDRKSILRLRESIFVDLVHDGIPEKEVCQRLRLTRKKYTNLLRKCFKIKDRQDLVIHVYVGILERLEKCRARRRRFEKIEAEGGELKHLQVANYLKFMAEERNLERDIRDMFGLDAPQRKEVTSTKTYSVVLVQPEELQPQVIEVESQPPQIPVPALTVSLPEDDMPFPSMDM